MPRPHCPRRVDAVPSRTYFKPRGVPVARLEEIQLTVDELESLRLADLEGLYHEDAAGRMNVSRPTFGRIVESARRKVAEALVRGRALRIEGGTVELPALRSFACPACRHRWQEPFGTGRPEACPRCGGKAFRRVDGGGGGPGGGHAAGVRRGDGGGGRRRE
jgi:predicted DNA-binding protein (UPF0251 family)